MQIKVRGKYRITSSDMKRKNTEIINSHIYDPTASYKIVVLTIHSGERMLFQGFLKRL